MAQTPTDAPTGYDANDHATFHNQMAAITNQLDPDAASNGDFVQLVGGVWVPRSAAEAGLSETGHSHVEADITNLDHDDPDAFHDNVSGEINALTQKSTPAAADVLVIEDSAASYAKRKVPWSSLPSGGGGGSGLSVFYVTSSQTISVGGVYVVNTSGGNRTITLPLVSTVGSTGMRVVVKRLGGNYCYVVTQGSDHFDLDSIDQKTLWVDDSAVSLAAIPSVANTWMEFGQFGNVVGE